MTPLVAELWFLSRDRAAIFWLVLALATTVTSVTIGMLEIQGQRAALSQLVEADEADRRAVISTQKDWGGAAYYTFHLTYDEPSNLAFAALGLRDVAPWKHRIRMLALEGQIYEADQSNPTFALVGRFDFAFVASMLVPLFVIFLLHSLRSRERGAGRFELLVATAGSVWRPWNHRAALRLLGLLLCVLGPLVFVGLWTLSDGRALAIACLAVTLHIALWWLLTEVVGRYTHTSATSLIILIGLWLGFAVLAPAVIKTAVDRMIPVSQGGQILLAQREAVNDAWDLPKAATMEPFVARHPKWRAYQHVDKPFEWKWYYAFQQMGDQAVERLSEDYRSGRRARDHLTAWLSLLSPPAWLERTLQMLAKTDVQANLAYEGSIRAFHAQLRSFYYPRLFEARPFDPAVLQTELPRFGEHP